VSETQWEAVIGLEIHVHLKTRTKMFCRCELEYFAEPNSRTCPVCLAFPGSLPVPNRLAIEHTITLGLALGSRIADEAVFARKNYFYQDLPKGYQISQYDKPLCLGGSLLVPGPGGEELRVGITRAHLEEDAAKSIHVGGADGRIVGAAHSLVDFNRGGTPLLEIVTEPDLHSADDTRRFLQLLRQTIVELGISDAEMEKGTLRCDANVSVRPAGSSELRTRCELKNVNSFAFVARGIDALVAQQIAIYEDGGEVKQETYDFDPASNRLTVHRAKEEADDYRYFPEPDLVPVVPDPALVERLRGALPELPGDRIRRLAPELGLETATGLVMGGRDRLHDALVAAGVDAKASANVLMNQLAAAGVEAGAVDAAELAKLIGARASIPRNAFDDALAHSADPGFSADAYLGEAAIADNAELDPVIDRIIAANPKEVEAYRGGKQGLLGFFVGQVMRETQGKASPQAVNELVRAKLG
jgi:aspartyl-tRNA(Asn)/glutamyl-tRNA(Gln) amidotransferase subunit B